MDNILNDQFVIIFHNKAVFLLKNPLKLMHIPNIIRIEIRRILENSNLWITWIWSITFIHNSDKQISA